MDVTPVLIKVVVTIVSRWQSEQVWVSVEIRINQVLMLLKFRVSRRVEYIPFVRICAAH